MKHMTRKPALPLLLLALLVFGVLFMTMFQKGIEDDAMQVEELYNSTRIIFQILPGESSGNTLALGLHKGERIAALDEVTEVYGQIRCLYSLREPESRPGLSTVFGTNDLDFLCAENNVAIDYYEGYGSDTFAQFDPYKVPCVMEESLQKELGLAPGAEFVISPTDYPGQDREDAPNLTLYLIGTYSDVLVNLAPMGLIVPEEIFLTDVTKPHLLYCSDMMYNCFYRQFSFRIDPAYNRDHSGIQEKVEDILSNATKFTLAPNTKALTLAVRPLERKLAIQRLLVTPLGFLFCAAAAIVALLMVLSFKREVFLRLMWGEKRLGVLLKLLFSVLFHLALCSALAILAVWLLAGEQWLSWAIKYLGLMNGLCLGATVFPLTYFCVKNLVKLYQAGEG